MGERTIIHIISMLAIIASHIGEVVLRMEAAYHVWAASGTGKLFSRGVLPAAGSKERRERYMAKVITFKSKEDIFAEKAMKSGLFDLDPFAFLTEADERELTMIGKAAYADKLKRRAEEKARREEEKAEEEELGIKKVVTFPGKL